MKETHDPLLKSVAASLNKNRAEAFLKGDHTKPISVLFVRKDSIYKSLTRDCWDIERNALNWPGGNPLIAHPPCRAWGQLAHFAKPRPDEKELAIWSIEQIRKHGGVLEHPRASKLWKVLNLPLGNEIDQYGGYTLSVNQHWWGHRAEKKTLLYIVGCKRMDLPAMPLNFDLITHVITNTARKGTRGYKKRVTQYERESTPIEFARWLIELAQRCQVS